jgi:hypothetical protein
MINIHATEKNKREKASIRYLKCSLSGCLSILMLRSGGRTNPIIAAIKTPIKKSNTPACRIGFGNALSMMKYKMIVTKKLYATQHAI